MTTKADILAILDKVSDDEVLALHVPFDVHDFKQHFITKAKAEEVYEESYADEFSTMIGFCIDYFGISAYKFMYPQNGFHDTDQHNIAVLRALPLKSNLTLEEWKEVVSRYEKWKLDDYSHSREVMTLSIIQTLLLRSSNGKILEIAPSFPFIT